MTDAPRFSTRPDSSSCDFGGVATGGELGGEVGGEAGGDVGAFAGAVVVATGPGAFAGVVGPGVGFDGDALAACARSSLTTTLCIVCGSSATLLSAQPSLRRITVVAAVSSSASG